MATQYGPYPHTGAGVEVRRMLYKLRSLAIELQRAGQGYLRRPRPGAPTKGLCNTRRFALGAILLYQLALLYRFQHDQPLRVGLKAFLKAA